MRHSSPRNLVLGVLALGVAAALLLHLVGGQRLFGFLSNLAMRPEVSEQARWLALLSLDTALVCWIAAGTVVFLIRSSKDRRATLWLSILCLFTAFLSGVQLPAYLAVCDQGAAAPVTWLQIIGASYGDDTLVLVVFGNLVAAAVAARALLTRWATQATRPDDPPLR